MDWRPAVLGLLAAMAWTGAAAASYPTLKDAAACRTAPDLAACLLDVASQMSQIRVGLHSDDELRREAPEMYAHLRVTADPPKVSAAVDAALAARKAGRPPERALKGIEALDDRKPPSGALAALKPSSPRLMGYRELWRAVEHSPADPFAQAALRGWERELAKAGGRADPGVDIESLMRAYLSTGDLAGARRVMVLDGPLDSAREIRRLTLLGDLDAAAAASRAASLASTEAVVRSEAGPAMAAGIALQETFVSLRAGILDAELKKMRAEGRDDEAAALEREAASHPPVQDLKTYFAETVRDEAQDRLNQARRILFDATYDKRADIAREAADAYLTGGGLSYPTATDLRRLLPSATPAVAMQWVREQETEIGKPVADELRAVTPSYLYMALSGWSVLGRKDRVDLLLDRWMPQAKEEALRSRSDPMAFGEGAHQVAQFLANEGRLAEAIPLTPYITNFLSHDISEGRGLVNFDAYAAAGDPHELLNHCIQTTSWKRDYGLMEACIAQGLTESQTDAMRIDYALKALEAAGSAERRGYSEKALRLWDIAADTATTTAEAGPPLVNHADALVQVAKAALRRDGRLPARSIQP